MCVFVSTCGDTGVCVGGVCVERLRVFGGRDVCMCVCIYVYPYKCLDGCT